MVYRGVGRWDKGRTEKKGSPLQQWGGGSMKLESWLDGLLESGLQLGGHFKGTENSKQERRKECLSAGWCHGWAVRGAPSLPSVFVKHSLQNAG